MTVTALDPAIFGEGSPCFGCAPTHPIGLKLRFEREGAVIRTRYVPRGDLQGPPGVMHGGLVTTLADEIAAWTVIGLKERFGFTASLTAKLERPLRIGLEAVGEGTIVRDSSRVVGVHVELHQAGERCFVGDFSFVILDRRGAERLLGGPLPAAWERFAR